MPTPPLVKDIHEEATQMLAVHGNYATCEDILSREFGAILQRTQVLLTLATLTLTITGFSGPSIAESGPFSRYTMVVGLVFVLAAILVALVGILRVRWTTQYATQEPVQALEAIIAYRNDKTRKFVVGMILLVIGLCLYVASLTAFLFHLG